MKTRDITKKLAEKLIKGIPIHEVISFLRDNGIRCQFGFNGVLQVSKSQIAEAKLLITQLVSDKEKEQTNDY